MRFGSVYIVTNKHTGEQYVGQTRQPLKRRFYSHISMAKSSTGKKYRLHEAIAKHGESAFEFSEFWVAFDEDALNQTEISLIECLRPVYNINRGGAGHRPFETPAKTRQLRSERMTALWGDPQWRAKQTYILKQVGRSEAARERGRRLASKGGVFVRWQNHVKAVPKRRSQKEATAQSWLNPEIRRRRIEGLKRSNATDEVRLRRSLASKGRVLPPDAIAKISAAKYKRVRCMELDVVFESQRDAATYFGVRTSTVSMAIINGRKLATQYTLVREV